MDASTYCPVLYVVYFLFLGMVTIFLVLGVLFIAGTGLAVVQFFQIWLWIYEDSNIGMSQPKDWYLD